MRTFEDSEGRTWGIRVSRGALRKVKADTGIVLTQLLEGNGERLQEEFSDTVLVGDILWSLVEDQARKREVSQEEFESSTEGDEFDRAVTQMVKAIADFFPKAQREILLKILDLGEEKALEKNEVLRQKLMPSSSTTNSQESAE